LNKKDHGSSELPFVVFFLWVRLVSVAIVDVVVDGALGLGPPVLLLLALEPKT